MRTEVTTRGVGILSCASVLATALLVVVNPGCSQSDGARAESVRQGLEGGVTSVDGANGAAYCPVACASACASATSSAWTAARASACTWLDTAVAGVGCTAVAFAAVCGNIYQSVFTAAAASACTARCTDGTSVPYGSIAPPIRYEMARQGWTAIQVELGCD